MVCITHMFYPFENLKPLCCSSSKVPREVVESIKSTKTPPAIIPYNPEEEDEDDSSNWTEEITDALWGVRDPHFLNKKKKDKQKDKHKGKDKKSKSKAFNFYSGKPDVENCYGWSRSMTNRDLETLRGSNIGMFMVNLTTVIMSYISGHIFSLLYPGKRPNVCFVSSICRAP